jgi:hypothetical protein
MPGAVAQPVGKLHKPNSEAEHLFLFMRSMIQETAPPRVYIEIQLTAELRS